ncbi:MAG: HAD-IA family hydrolase [Streptosporangiaceae bacterium]|nr:HAD-IA family hydrolase [Streptosporangiaceae bacterium]
MAYMDACLVDAYGTMLDADFGARGRELSELAGLSADEMHDAYVRLEPALSVGELSRLEGYELILRTYGIEPRDDLLRKLAARERELLLADGFVFDDTMPFLEGLKARGIKIAVVSNCGEFTRDLLFSLGVAALADALVLSCEVGCVKPSPRIYRHALKELGVAAEAALFVDDQAVFCAGAEAIGVKGVQIVRGAAVPGRAAPVVRSLLEVEAYL